VAGKIYVAGGRPPRGSDFAVYDPALDSWRTLPDLPTQRNHVGAAAIDGKVYVVGGRLEAGFQSEQTDRVEVYDPVTNAWSTRAPMLRPRGGVNAVAANGYLHVFGGEGNAGAPSGVYPDHDVYDPVANRWIRLGPIPVPVHGVTGASFVNGVIHLTDVKPKPHESRRNRPNRNPKRTTEPAERICSVRARAGPRQDERFLIKIPFAR
jgi:hypothetical protein